MTKEIEALREYLSTFLEGHPSIDEVKPKREGSRKVHLSVYRTKSGSPVGIEFDKDTLQNIWLRKSDTSPSSWPDIKVTAKNWDGAGWKSEDGKGANHNLKHYDDFPGHDLVRFGVKNKQQAHAVLDHLFSNGRTKRYLIKVNGDLRCPQNISRPNSSADWEGGEILIEARSPVLARVGGHLEAPNISEGDELWIWTHEDEQFGGGLGLTAKAIAGKQKPADGDTALELRNVTLLPRPFGFRDLGVGPTGSRLIDYIRTYRHRLVYLIEDDDYEDFERVVDDHSRELSDAVRYSYSEGWEREIHNHKKDLLQGLKERKLSTQKARPGQAQFREALMRRYKGRCVVSKCSIPEAIEAAHVMPHTGDPKWDHPDNGLLLRRDLHSLFDAMLWSIDPKSNKLRISDRLRTTTYRKLDGRNIEHSVSPALLEVHFRQFKKGGEDG